MKQKHFLMKFLCFFVLLIALRRYQVIASLRAAEEAEQEAKIAEIEAYNKEILRQMNEAEENASPYEDGVFEGEAEGFGGVIRVSVKIEEGDLSEIEVLEAKGEDPAYYEQAESVLDEILRNQGVDVDTVSGATFSSTGLIRAVTEALRKAVR